MKPHVLHASSVADMETQLERIVERDEYRATLAFVFAGSRIINSDTARPFTDRGIAVFGGASGEEIADGTLSRESISVMLLDIDPEAFALTRYGPGSEPAAAADIGARIARWAESSFSSPAVVLLVGGGGTTIGVDELLNGIFGTIPDLPVFGGLASGPLDELIAPPILDGDGLHADGVLALALDNAVIDIRGVALSGWREIGTSKRITKARGNVVYEIDGMPAARFYREYFGVDPSRPEQILTASEYPIRLMRDDGTLTIRTALGIDPQEETVSFAGTIPEGSRVRFCSPNILQTIQQTVEDLQRFRDTLTPAGADAVLLFDCAIRSRSFGPYMQREVEMIKQLWRAPMAGFSSWGEIGQAPGEACSFHNTVISTVLLRARDGDGVVGAARLSARQVQTSIEPAGAEESVEALKAEVAQLRKQKTMLSNFLHLNSDDLEAERRKSEELLLNILPASIADRLKNGEKRIADRSEEATILFADLVNFTSMSSSMSPDHLVARLNLLFSSFDDLAEQVGVEKIKTIGDAYMAVTGVPDPRSDHAPAAISFARGMMRIMEKFNRSYETELALRIGVNSGPVVAGVIGKRKFSYDLWGDTVNVASRMESSGLPGNIQVSESTRRLLGDQWSFEDRGEVEIKGKGRMRVFLLLDDPGSTGVRQMRD